MPTLTKLEIVTSVSRQRLLFTPLGKETTLKYGMLAIESNGELLVCNMPVNPETQHEVKQDLAALLPNAVLCQPTGAHSFAPVR